MIDRNEINEIGKFQKTHALKGELNAILNIDPEYVEDGNALVIEIDGIYVPFYASSLRPKGSTSYLLKLDGVDTEQDAKQFVNKPIYAMKSELAPYFDLDEDDIHDEGDMEGFVILDSQTGESIGTISRVDSSTENLLFIVEDADGQDIYIPAVEDLIDGVDEARRTITMRLPEGLIDLNRKTTE